MALNVNRLGDAMKAAVDAVEDKTDRQEVFRALAEAVVTEIITNATVTGTATGATGGGPGVPIVGTVS